MIKPDQENRKGSSVGKEKIDLKKGDFGDVNQGREIIGMEF